MQLFSKVDIGKVRLSNQDAADAFMIAEDVAFAVVCDGMGGANGGDIASSTAVKAISGYVKKSYVCNMSNEKKAQLLKNAVSSANYEINNLSKKDSALSGMGTTVVAAIVTERYAVVCHVGDSRAYLVNDSIVQITKDHSVVQSLIEKGEITVNEAKSLPEKNIITRALGVESDVFSDISVVPVKSDDKLLLCTDGLTNFTEASDILKIFKQNQIENVAGLLVNAANSGGGGDNIAVVIVSQKRG
ncbi:MAG: Stp1/IreP family PP2C-type Ser/Thr phosphatase [Clostridia bacterium]|nr:Stp1/IreP family PP2C-type Ser/Thr phosphatase [Clostridia bacterium]